MSKAYCYQDLCGGGGGHYYWKINKVNKIVGNAMAGITPVFAMKKELKNQQQP